MPLYKVGMTIEVVIMADSEAEAMAQASGALREEARNGSFDWATIDEVTSAGDLPEGWDMQTLVYGQHKSEVTVEQALLAGFTRREEKD